MKQGDPRDGGQRENETVLEPFDMIYLPKAFCRDFTNIVDDNAAYLLVLITGGSEQDYNDIGSLHRSPEKLRTPSVLRSPEKCRRSASPSWGKGTEELNMNGEIMVFAILPNKGHCRTWPSEGHMRRHEALFASKLSPE